MKRKNTVYQTSLVVQVLRIRLPTQGLQVRPLVQEDSMCCGLVLWSN